MKLKYLQTNRKNINMEFVLKLQAKSLSKTLCNKIEHADFIFMIQSCGVVVWTQEHNDLADNSSHLLLAFNQIILENLALKIYFNRNLPTSSISAKFRRKKAETGWPFPGERKSRRPGRTASRRSNTSSWFCPRSAPLLAGRRNKSSGTWRSYRKETYAT